MHFNTTCPLPKDQRSLDLVAKPIIGSLTFQRLALFISLGSTGIACFLSLWLAFKHLHRFTEPMQQRQIIRVIFTPVIFSFYSAMSILNYNAAIYLIPIRDLYETFALASVFLLYIEYVAPDTETRDEYFEKLENQKSKSWKPWDKSFTVIPGGSLSWFQNRYTAVFLYCFAMIVTTIVQEITQATKTFCATSFSPVFANIWILIVQNIAVTVAINGVLQFYVRLTRVPEFTTIHKPLPKLISFKLIVFINFVQDLGFSLLTSENIIKGNSSLTVKDFSIAIPALLVSIEQIGFAAFFHYSFNSHEYLPTEKGPYATRLGTLKAATMAFNAFDIIRGIINAFTLLLSGVNPYARAKKPQTYKLSRVGMEPLRTGPDDYNGFEYSSGYQNVKNEHQIAVSLLGSEAYAQPQYPAGTGSYAQPQYPAGVQQMPSEGMYQPPGSSPPGYGSEMHRLRPERSTSSELDVHAREAYGTRQMV